jgi:DNA modification methylase
MAKITEGKVSDFRPDSNNANQGTVFGQKLLRGSIERNKLGRSIVADSNNTVIAGNKTLETVADLLGVDSKVLIVETDGDTLIVHKRTDLDLTDPNPQNEARQLAYEDNTTSFFSFSLDPEIVLPDIENGFDFEAIDLNPSDLTKMLENVPKGLFDNADEKRDTESQIDKAEEFLQKYGVKLGQLWQLGNHWMACGDCTDKAIVKRVMRDELFDLMVTDPPYGVDYTGGRNPISNIPREKIKGDNKAAGVHAKFIPIWVDYRKRKGSLYIWFADRGGKPVYDAIQNSGFEVRALIVWNKLDPHYGNFMAQYMQKHEPCLYCVKDGSNWYGPTNEVTVWDIKQPTRNENHPTEKPLECMERPIKNSSKINDIVVDPFLGSGTTLIACENLGRQCRGIEIDPRYVAVTLERYFQHTNVKPQLIDTV